jgi:hypothetical protein
MKQDDDFPVPPGYVIHKRGGRPAKTARDVAIFLAKYWREKHLGEMTKQADAWILERWGSHGIKDDSAHIRRAVRNAEKTWLKGAEIKVLPNGAVYAANITDATPDKIELWRWAWADEDGHMLQAQSATAVRKS